MRGCWSISRRRWRCSGRRGRQRPGGRAALAGFAAAAGFYLVYWPTNYFGGDTCIGNRYLLAAYPCLLFAPARLPSARRAASPGRWASSSPRRRSFGGDDRGARPVGSQNHAYAGVFRWLPYESTASHIEGRRDRYWRATSSASSIRSPHVEPASFVLAAGAPAAELEIATSWTARPAPAGDVRRARRHARGLRLVAPPRIPLGAQAAAAPAGRSTWRPAPAWRVHPFWWRDETARTARGSCACACERGAGRDGAHALSRPSQACPQTASARSARVALPTTAIAGERTLDRGRVVNRGSGRGARATLPVHLAAIAGGADGGGDARGARELPEIVWPGGTLAAEIELEWPQSAGALPADRRPRARGASPGSAIASAPAGDGRGHGPAGAGSCSRAEWSVRSKSASGTARGSIATNST
jgi:hypothetical protein